VIADHLRIEGLPLRTADKRRLRNEAVPQSAAAVYPQSAVVVPQSAVHPKLVVRSIYTVD
jgi:hypothetical protein